MGEHGRGRERAGDPGGLVGDPAQDGADRVSHLVLAAAQQQPALVDAALRVGLEAGRVEPGAADGVLPDKEPPVGLRVHGRGQQEARVEQQRLRRAGTGEGGDRMRRTEVNAEPGSWA